jgi:deoxyribonuclease-4
MKIGFHVSISGGVDKAVHYANNLGVNTFQIFTRNPRRWKTRNLNYNEVENFKKQKEKYGIYPIFSHMPYLPNLATSRKDVYKKSIIALETEIMNCKKLKIPFIVTHLGSHLGSGMEKGIQKIVNAINVTRDKFKQIPIILFENSSGKTNEIGSTFQEIATIMDLIDSQTGFCLDTCHAFTRGYDLKSNKSLDNTIKEIDDFIGLKNLHLVHLNDSKGELGSRTDFHEHIGMGYIGENGFRNILNSSLITKPLILETPVNEIRDDLGNLNKLYELLGMCK